MLCCAVSLLWLFCSLLRFLESHLLKAISSIDEHRSGERDCLGLQSTAEFFPHLWFLSLGRRNSHGEGRGGEAELQKVMLKVVQGFVEHLCCSRVTAP